jgi:hypothetical protein
MGKGLLVSKNVISIQFSRDNLLQGMTLNALIRLIIPSNKNNSSNNKKPKRNKKCKHKKH